jgi:lysophospholipase L1-like esterase
MLRWIPVLFGLLAAGAAGAQTRLLPIGDSITQGGQGHASWRYPLFFSLGGAGVLDLVGSRDFVFGEAPGSNPSPALYPDYYTAFDRDHEGYWGYRTDQVLAFVVSSTAAAAPDVVTIALGTNDIGQSGASGTAQASANLAYLVDAVRSVRPNVPILLGQLVPIGPGTSYFGAGAPQVPLLNAQIAALAAAMTRPASPVLAVDQGASFALATDMQPDGLHPNELGEAEIAAQWAAALGPWLAGPPAVPPSTPPSVAEPGFEALALSDGQVVGFPGSSWGWRRIPGAESGIFDPTAASYPDAAGAGTPAGAEGSDVLYLYASGGADAPAAAFQTLPTTLTSGRKYTLRVAVGNRLPGNPYATSWGGFRVELLAGNTVIAARADGFVPDPGTFRDVSMSVRAANLPAALVGRPLTIRLSATSTAALAATDFDHVRLSVTSGACGLLGPEALLALAPFARARRRLRALPPPA